MTARFPAIVPGTGVGEDAWFAYGRGRGSKVLSRGEPFVGEAEDAGAERFTDQVCI